MFIVYHSKLKNRMSRLKDNDCTNQNSRRYQQTDYFHFDCSVWLFLKFVRKKKKRSS